MEAFIVAVKWKTAQIHVNRNLTIFNKILHECTFLLSNPTFSPYQEDIPPPPQKNPIVTCTELFIMAVFVKSKDYKHVKHILK